MRQGNILKKVSVCVPAYNRPRMMAQLIKTYQNQDYPNRELVISDDSTDDSVRDVVRSFDDPTIVYSRNPRNIGYCRNFLEALRRATGDYIVVLGDDDLLMSRRCLSVYAGVFDEHEDVAYIYSNMFQVSPNLKIDYVYHFFARDTVFQKGEDAFRNIWMTSTFIAGIGLRNSFDLGEIYPEDYILFPQTMMVGHIIAGHGAYGISDFLIAARSHEEQLGFFALKGERIKGGEKHWTTEMFTIFDELSERYRFDFGDEFLSKRVIRNYSMMIMKDKMLAGNRNIRESYRDLCGLSEAARRSKILRLAYVASLMLPRFAIRVIRSLFIRIRKVRDGSLIRKTEKELSDILE